MLKGCREKRRARQGNRHQNTSHCDFKDSRYTFPSFFLPLAALRSGCWDYLFISTYMEKTVVLACRLRLDSEHI
jgi:hypothetical protein